MTSTRRHTEVFGLGPGIGEDDGEIHGSRLPTSRAVLRCFMYHLNVGKALRRTKFETAKSIYGKIVPFFEKAHVPSLSEKVSCGKIIEMYEKNAKLREIPVARRETPTTLTRLEAMQNLLSKTFVMWPADVEKRIENLEDLSFLKSMMNDRKATFGSHDSILALQVGRKQDLEMQAAERTQREVERKRDDIENALPMMLDSDEESDSDNDPEPRPSTSSTG